MTMVRFEISMSLDGFVAGPNATLEDPLGEGGERLHEWVFGLASWRATHGREGGATGPDDDLLQESVDRTGATVMGRKMFSGGEGPWEHDPNAGGWWGDDPPFRQPVFVLTQYGREPVVHRNGTTFNFVTDGIEAALDQAKAAAGDRDVSIAAACSRTSTSARANTRPPSSRSRMRCGRSSPSWSRPSRSRRCGPRTRPAPHSSRRPPTSRSRPTAAG